MVPQALSIKQHQCCKRVPQTRRMMIHMKEHMMAGIRHCYPGANLDVTILQTFCTFQAEAHWAQLVANLGHSPEQAMRAWVLHDLFR